jgi:hypothetical protein
VLMVFCAVGRQEFQLGNVPAENPGELRSPGQPRAAVPT